MSSRRSGGVVVGRMTLREVINSTKQEVDDKEREKYEAEQRREAERRALLQLDAKRKREEERIGTRAEWIKSERAEERAPARLVDAAGSTRARRAHG